MKETINGRTALRPVDGHKATGMCTYTRSGSNTQLYIAAQSFEQGAALQAVPQLGPAQGYRMLDAAEIGGESNITGPMPDALWILDRGRPVLFGKLSGTLFDQQAARAALQSGAHEVPMARVMQAATPAVSAKAAAQVPEPVVEEEKTLRVAAMPASSPQPAIAQELPVFGQGISGADVEADGEVETLFAPDCSCAEEEAPPEGWQEQADSAAEAAAQQGANIPAHSVPELVPGHLPPIVLRRAPREPRQPVYSPLWDDVSAEFDKMLDSLPDQKPFAGGDGTTRFSELPLDGAVQCYIGSVTVNGMRVYLQAVPARPYGRPAGFDHTLLSRSGDSYWVKYFIVN